MKSSWWCLPGFLGDESHFGGLWPLLDKPRLISALEFADAQDLASAARLVAQFALASGERPHLLGYSMGGRLALQIALEAPGVFSSITAISAHPGFSSVEDLRERQGDDSRWAKLLLEDWDKFWSQWNQRGALSGTPIPEIAAPTPLERRQWANVLENWGTGRQAYLPPLLRDSPAALQCVVGGNDRTYVKHLESYPFNVKKVTIPGAGHRVPLERPHELAEVLRDWALENL